MKRELKYKSYSHISGNDNSVLTNHTVEELHGALIVRDEPNFCYYVFESHRAAYNALRSETVTPCWHEVILDFMPQRLRIDIDIPVDDDFESMRGNSEIMKKVYMNDEEDTGEIKICSACKYPIGSCEICQGTPIKMKSANDLRAEYILRTIMKSYSRVLPGISYTVCTSHGEDKYSFHVISNAYSETSSAIYKKCQEIYDILPGEVKPYFDRGVCSRGTHNLRLCGAVKNDGSSRIKIRDGEINFESWRETLVTYISSQCISLGEELDAPITESNGYHDEVEYELTDDMLEQLRPYHQGLRYSHRVGNFLIFRRIAPSNCVICARVHEKDNSIYVILHQNYMRIKCRRDYDNKTNGICLSYRGEYICEVLQGE